MKRIIHTEKAPAAVGPYSQAVEKNGMLFISGQIAINPSTGKVIEGGIRVQTRQVLENIGEILAEAGYSKPEVLKCTCLLKDMDHFKEMNAVYGEFFGEDPPARAAYEVVRLPLDVLIEVEAIAMK